MGSTPISDTMKNLILKYCYWMYDGWQRRKSSSVDFPGRVAVSILLLIITTGVTAAITAGLMQDAVLTLCIITGIAIIIGTPWIALLIGRHLNNKPQ